jgi:glycosyltransferase involved in cell wall biosynthesis
LTEIQLSIIIPSLNEGKNLEETVFNINETIGLDNYEVIIINSKQGLGRTETASIRRLPMVQICDSPSRLGAPHARNFGAKKASSDFLLFADAHLQFFNEGWGRKIVKDLEVYRNCIICSSFLSSCGWRWRDLSLDTEILPTKSYIHEIPFGGAAFMGVEKNFFHTIGEFDSGIRLFGTGDVEISLRTWLLGHRVLCDPSIKIGHRSSDTRRIPYGHRREYTFEQIDLLHNRIRMAISHFNSQRLSKYMRLRSEAYRRRLGGHSILNEALFMAIEGGVLERREILFKKRVVTDDEFFEKFPMKGCTKEEIS